jgi:hypothetical protein
MANTTRKVTAHSTASNDDLDLMEAAYERASEDTRKVLDLTWSSATRGQATRELLLATLLAAQSAQIEELRERVTQLERAG